MFFAIPCLSASLFDNVVIHVLSIFIIYAFESFTMPTFKYAVIYWRVNATLYVGVFRVTLARRYPAVYEQIQSQNQCGYLHTRQAIQNYAVFLLCSPLLASPLPRHTQLRTDRRRQLIE